MDKWMDESMLNKIESNLSTPSKLFVFLVCMTRYIYIFQI